MKQKLIDAFHVTSGVLIVLWMVCFALFLAILPFWGLYKIFRP